MDLISDEKLVEIIDIDGLGYSVLHGLDSKRIANPEIRQLWEEAYQALSSIKQLLDEVVED